MNHSRFKIVISLWIIWFVVTFIVGNESFSWASLIVVIVFSFWFLFISGRQSDDEW